MEKRTGAEGGRGREEMALEGREEEGKKDGEEKDEEQE